MAKFPSLPLFTDAIMSDCAHLTDEEFGLYVRILITMWRSPGCKIPAKAEWLEKRFRKAIAEIGPLLSEFCLCDGNFWEQGRLSDEYAWVQKNSKKQSVRAKSRWEKRKIDIAAHAETHISGNAPIPHPTPPIPQVIEPSGSITPISPKPSGEFVFEDTIQTAGMLFEIFWNEYPKIRPRGNKGEAKDKFLKLLNDGENHDHIINGAREYANYCKNTGSYNKDASTFLNPKQRRWLGEWDSSTEGTGRTGLHALAEGARRAIDDDQ